MRKDCYLNGVVEIYKSKIVKGVVDRFTVVKES